MVGMKDRFDEILRDRLQNLEIVPPTDIWGKIDSSLNSIPNITHVPKRRFLGTAIAIGGIAAALAISFLIFEVNKDKPNVIVAELDPVILLPKEESPREKIILKSSASAQEIANDPIYTVARAAAVAPRRKDTPIAMSAPLNKGNYSKGNVDIPKNEKTCIYKEEKKANIENETIKNNEYNYNKESRAIQNYSGIIRSNIAKKHKVKKNRGIKFGLSGSSSFMANKSDLPKSDYCIDNLSLSKHTFSCSDYDWNHELPLSAAFTVQKMFNRTIGIETGLVYTYLASNSETSNSIDIKIKQKLHYLGIPISLVCNIIDGNKFDFYAKGGILIDKAISSTHQIFFKDDVTNEKLEMNGVQLSASVQLGVSYSVSDLVSLYVEPSMNYNFDSKQIDSYRTENSYGFSALVGVRFRLK